MSRNPKSMTARALVLSLVALASVLLSASGPVFASASPVAVTDAGAVTVAEAEADDVKAPADFVALSSVDRSIIQEMRYATEHNFVGAPVEGYVQPMCVLTKPAALALHQVQLKLLATGYSLKVYDCYRPQRAVDNFVSWAEDLSAQTMKGEFYPDEDKADLFTDGYIAAKSGHSRGSTVDLTIVRLPATKTRAYVPGEPLVPCYAAQDARFPDNSIDMGTGFDCFDTRANTLDPRITGVQLANRLLLKNAMEAAGFTNLLVEWWHYTLTNEPYPSTYFDVPITRASRTP